jgi:hypothetical protein
MTPLLLMQGTKGMGRGGRKGMQQAQSAHRIFISSLGQCKCCKTPVGPRDVREFEGVLHEKYSRLKNFGVGGGEDGNLHLGVMVSRSW